MTDRAGDRTGSPSSHPAVMNTVPFPRPVVQWDPPSPSQHSRGDSQRPVIVLSLKPEAVSCLVLNHSGHVAALPWPPHAVPAGKLLPPKHPLMPHSEAGYWCPQGSPGGLGGSQSPVQGWRRGALVEAHPHCSLGTPGPALPQRVGGSSQVPGLPQPQTCVSPTVWLSGLPSSPTPHPWPRDLRALDPPAKCPPGPAPGPERPSCTGQMLSPRGWPDAPRGKVASGRQQGREPSPERQHPTLLPGWGPTTGRGRPALGGGGGTAQWAL